MTNADRIRQMTDAELAVYLRNFDECVVCQVECSREYHCVEGILAWLKQEAKEDVGNS